MSVFEGISFPKVIFETTSEYNGNIQVIEVGRTRKLSVSNFVQSVNVDSPVVPKMFWGKVVKVLKENEPNLQSILILGLGGGTMQHLIARTFPGISITSVEIDPVMVDVAKQFFDVDKIPRHRIIVDDACRVIALPEEFGISGHSFNALIVDIYCGDQYPDLGKSGTFFDGLSNIVIPGGLIAFNRLYIHSHQEDVNHFIEMVEDYLHDVKSVIIAGKTNSDNVLIFGRT